MTPEQKERENALARARRANMTSEQREKHLEKNRERNLIANMTPEQIKRHRERGRVANMTPEQIQRRSERNRKRYANLTPEERECRNERHRHTERKRRARRTPEMRAQRKEQCRKWQHENWARMLLHSASLNSKKRKHPPPTITEEWILAQPLECPYTRMPLIPPCDSDKAGQRCPWKPSLDREDCTLGYTPENTKLTSWFWNCYRGELPANVAMAHLTKWQWALFQKVQNE